MSTKENILKSIAPCSMFCSTCTGCSYGEISNHAKKLLHYLEGHEEFLEKNLKKGYEHKLEEFRIFHRKLKKYAYPKCNGCRDKRANGYSIKDCIIPACTKEHNIDFCAECEEFPCTKVNDTIYKKKTIDKWKKGNEEIQKEGLLTYYERNKETPHYINYSKNKRS